MLVTPDMGRIQPDSVTSDPNTNTQCTKSKAGLVKVRRGALKRVLSTET